MEMSIVLAIGAGVVVGGIIYLCRCRAATQNKIVEFWMLWFNSEGMEAAFSHISTIYEEILRKDPLWHYFYEGDYSLIRCSKKYEKAVAKYLRENNITFKKPKEWKEGLYVTQKYQYIFKHIFHQTSVLALELFKNEDFKFYVSAADRIIHPFFNQSLYPAKTAGLCDHLESSDIDFQYWEVEAMTRLATGRSFHIGKIVGKKEERDRFTKKEKTEGEV